MASTRKVPMDLTKRNKSRSGGTLREGGAEWEIAEASMYDDVHSDPEECHE